MDSNQPASWIAFDHTTCVASGAPLDVARQAKDWVERHQDANLLVFNALTSEPIELDLRGSRTAVLGRAASHPTLLAPHPPEDLPAPARGPGRPRLGVVAREVTLLPRHWEWLASQSGGASVALRKLVEQAARANQHVDALRVARESAYRFMNAMAGDEPGFEEATRALFHGDLASAAKHMAAWPTDVRKHAVKLLRATRAAEGPTGDQTIKVE